MLILKFAIDFYDLELVLMNELVIMKIVAKHSQISYYKWKV